MALRNIHGRARKRARHSAPAEYIYQPLESPQHIRLLLLQPAATLTDPLVCDVVQRPLDKEAPRRDRYDVVSYAWGDPVFSCQLTCTNGSRLHITTSVDQLLRFLRKPHNARTLWIDGVCLNQRDEKEKAEQIFRMHEIYLTARKLHIWLGEGSDLTESLFASLERLHRAGAHPEDKEAALSVLTTDEAATELCRLSSLAWFDRRWILQEAALGVQTLIHVGQVTIARQVLAGSLHLLLDSVQPDYIHDWLKKAVRIFKLRASKLSLIQLLREFQASQCSQDNDRVFALLGIASDRASYSLQYSSSYQELCQSVASDAVKMGLGPTILRYSWLQADHTQSGSENPSWIPSWPLSDVKTDPFEMHACRSSAINLVPLQKQRLRASVRSMGRVQYTTAKLSPSMSLVEFLAELGCLTESLMVRDHHGSHDGRNRLTDIVFSILKPQIPESVSTMAMSVYRSLMYYVTRQYPIPELQPSGLLEELQLMSIHEWQKMLNQYIKTLPDGCRGILDSLRASATKRLDGWKLCLVKPSLLGRPGGPSGFLIAVAHDTVDESCLIAGWINGCCGGNLGTMMLQPAGDHVSNTGSPLHCSYRGPCAVASFKAYSNSQWTLFEALSGYPKQTFVIH